MNRRCSLPLVRAELLEREVFRRLGDFLANDSVFNKALMLANASAGGNAETLEGLSEEQTRLDAAFRKLEQREHRLAGGIMDALISKDAAQAKRRELDAEKGRLDRQLIDLRTKQATLERDAAHLKQIDTARQKYLKRVHRLDDLAAQEKQDLLRSLLPPDGDGRIIVHVVDKDTPNDPENPEPLGTVYIEMNGLLPIEQAVYNKAVLGGALAVP